mmetsp:Transcript_27030/g.62820  ORF Transcript_27030/g.62820 Transcript_27030/m.62820 type:complete len:139 (-) Transcript_27030:793-1209(-)
MNCLCDRIAAAPEHRPYRWQHRLYSSGKSSSVMRKSLMANVMTNRLALFNTTNDSLPGSNTRHWSPPDHANPHASKTCTAYKQNVRHVNNGASNSHLLRTSILALPHVLGKGWFVVESDGPNRSISGLFHKIVQHLQQ